MAHRQDYFAERVDRFISMASCYAPNLYLGIHTYEQVSALFLKLYELDIITFYGDDAVSDTYEGMLCRVLGGAYCLLPHDQGDTLAF